MSIFLERDNLFGDFSNEPKAVDAWKDFKFLFTEVLPALEVTPEAFYDYIPQLHERTQKFLAVLFAKTDDNRTYKYGRQMLEDIAEDYEGGIEEYLIAGGRERILGGHEYFIKEAVFDLLYTVCEEYEHEEFSGKKNPAKKFHQLFKPYSARYIDSVADASGFLTSELGAHYAAYAKLHDDYIQWQNEGIERFTDAYVQNHKLFEAIKDRLAVLGSKRWMSSLALDFDRAHEIIKAKYEFCGIVENLLAQAFDVDLPKHAIRNLKSSLATHNGTNRSINYDESYLFKASLNHLLCTIIHEFCHHLQREMQLRSDQTQKYIHRDRHDKMVFFFHSGFYRNGDESQFLYDENILERDANDFSERCFARLASKQLHHDVDHALAGLMQPDAAHG